MHNSFLPGLLLLLLVFICLGIILAGLRKALPATGWTKQQQRSFFIRTILIIIAWMVLLLILATRGFFRNFQPPPRVVFTILIPVIAMLIFSFTVKGNQLLLAIPAHWLVTFQSFRIFVELVLWMAFLRGLLPEQMTFEGRNFDVIAGILALAAGWLIWKHKGGDRKILVAFNIIGLALLLNILVIAVLSVPGPLRYFMNEPANVIVADFPFIYLPGVLVVIAAGFHILSLRQLFVKQA